MTHKEAVKILRGAIKKPNTEDSYMGQALSLAVEALEKQIPRPPILEADGYADGVMVYDRWYCPRCDMDYDTEYEKHDHCPVCGQAILWEENND